MQTLKDRISDLACKAGNACVEAVTSPQFAPALLVAVLVSEFGILIVKADRKLFWYDELLTFHVSSLQPLSLLLNALKEGADGMPLGYYLMVRLARMLPVDPHITLRLPSILGYLLTLLGVYWFARKKMPAIASLTAVILITLSPFREYAIEARSYSLLVGFLAISAAIWQRVDEKPFMTPLLAIFLSLAVSSHHLAIVSLASFGLAELIWTLLSRRVRWGIWAACFLSTFSFFINLPNLLHFKSIFGQNFWSRPTWQMAVRTYGDFLGLDQKLVLGLILFFALVVGDSLLRHMRHRTEGKRDHDFGIPEIILVSGFLFYPALMVVLTKLLDSGYASRYGWPVILGLALGSVYLLRTIWLKPSSTYLLVAFIIAFTRAEVSEFREMYTASSSRTDRRWTKLTEASRSEPGIPVVIGSPMTYLEAAAYSPPELRGHLVEIFDLETATRISGTDSPDKVNRALARFIPLHIEDLAPFQAQHQKFILRSDASYDWVTKYLLESRYHLTLLSQDGANSNYLAIR